MKSTISKYGKTEDEHKYSSTQVNLEGAIAAKILALAKKIPDSDLAEDGREGEPHVTVRYGLHADSPGPAKPIIQSEPRMQATFKGISIFPADGERGSDVVKLDLDSVGLCRLNKKLAALPHTDTHPSYHPHVTLAYVKPGKGKKYTGESGLEGTSVEMKSVVFSDKKRNKTAIQLGRSGVRNYRSV